MNRPIRFRAWNKETKEMHERDISSVTNWLLYPETYEMMQFTGLSDRHGKEIYEGDIIVQVATQHGTGRRLEFKKQAVEMKPFYFADYEDSCAGSGFMIESCSLEEIEKEWEVIGNIWESPELLK